MNILHVLSQFEVTGAETFAATLADEQIKNGHSVFIISDTFHTPTKAAITNHPIGKRDLKQRFENVSFLKRFIRENTINVVDAHSRAASWVSYFATRGGTTPLVSHIHAQQHIHFSSRHFPIYGEKLVAVCNTIYSHLNRDLAFPLERLALVRNGIDLSQWHPGKGKKKGNSPKVVAYVGRLSGFKGDTLLTLIEKTFPEVLKEIGDVEIHVIGGMSEKSKILPTIEKVNAQTGKEFIVPKGFSNNVQEIYHTADVIIGSGRVAMEALASGATVISVGESNYVGILSEKTKDLALETNFGDLDKRSDIEPLATARDIISILKGKEKDHKNWGRAFVAAEFNIETIAPSLDRVYAEACSEKRAVHELPILYYKKITERDDDSTSVPPIEFEQQIRFLHEKNFSFLTFYDLREIVAFKRVMPKKPIIITIDGYEENFQSAFQLLKGLGIPAVFFLQSKSFNGSPSLSNEQMKELTENNFEIGSLSETGRKFNLIGLEEIVREVKNSRRTLSKATEREVISFAYPDGVAPQSVKSILEKEGYIFAVTKDKGRRSFWSDLLKIRRIQIEKEVSKFSYWKMTSGWYYWIENVY